MFFFRFFLRFPLKKILSHSLIICVSCVFLRLQFFALLFLKWIPDKSYITDSEQNLHYLCVLECTVCANISRCSAILSWMNEKYKASGTSLFTSRKRTEEAQVLLILNIVKNLIEIEKNEECNETWKEMRNKPTKSVRLLWANSMPTRYAAKWKRTFWVVRERKCIFLSQNQTNIEMKYLTYIYKKDEANLFFRRYIEREGAEIQARHRKSAMVSSEISQSIARFPFFLILLFSVSML